MTSGTAQVPGIYKIRYIGQTTLSSAAVRACFESALQSEQLREGLKMAELILADLVITGLSPCRCLVSSWERVHCCIAGGNDLIRLLVLYQDQRRTKVSLCTSAHACM